MLRLVVAAQKGGAGKTTVAVNLAGALATLGHRLLVIDSDPQGAAASALGVSPRKPTLYEVLTGEAELREAIVPSATPGLALLPSDLDLAGAEVELPVLPDWQHTLARRLASLEPYCDVAVIDTPPGLGVLSYTAMQAATAALVVCPLEFLAVRSLPYLQETTARAGLRILGIVPTLTSSSTRHAREAAESLREAHGELLLPPIPRRVALQDAALAGQPITEFQPAGDAAAAFLALAKEVLNRG